VEERYERYERYEARLAFDSTRVCGFEIQNIRGKEVNGTWLLHTLHGNGGL
jgi:hypothetical protein